MLNVLPESRPRRQRRTGGATTSVALHVAIIGVVTATTAQLPRDTGREPVTMVPLPPIVERRVTSQPDAGAPVASRGIATTVLRRITLTEIPTTIPPIDLSAPATPDPGTGVVDFGPPGSTTLGGRGIPAARDTGSGTWNASETLMRVISVIRPRYPEPLRNAGVSGHVLVQFVVDTTGRVEPRSAKIIESTHDLFSRAVLDVVGGLRFRPTEVNGRKVRALAEMPFEFVLK